MMEGLLDRATAIGRAAQLQRLERIAAAFRTQGLAAVIVGDSIAVRGRKLAQRWLADPLLRFAGRVAQ